jgi:hypothetical protein
MTLSTRLRLQEHYLKTGNTKALNDLYFRHPELRKPVEVKVEAKPEVKTNEKPKRR